MKISFSYAFLALLLIAAPSFAQQATNFKFTYQPSHTYSNTVHSGYNMTMRITGDAKVQARMKAQGLKQPILMNMRNDGVLTVRTGNSDSSSNVPLAMHYDKLVTEVTFNGQHTQQQSPLTGKSLYGKFTDGKIRLDSVAGIIKSDTVLNAVTQMINGIFNEYKFPDKDLKIGESFTQSIPLTIPIPGSNTMHADMKITYTLLSIANGKATFRLAESVVYNMMISNRTMRAGGLGTGTMIYDIDKQFATSYTNNLNVKMTAHMDKTSAMSIVLNATSVNSTTIKAN